MLNQAPQYTPLSSHTSVKSATSPSSAPRISKSTRKYIPRNTTPSTSIQKLSLSPTLDSLRASEETLCQILRVLIRLSGPRRSRYRPMLSPANCRYQSLGPSQDRSHCRKALLVCGHDEAISPRSKAFQQILAFCPRLLRNSSIPLYIISPQSLTTFTGFNRPGKYSARMVALALSHPAV